MPFRKNTELIWNERAERVEESRRSSYGQITLEEKTIPARPSQEAARMLASMVLSKQSSGIYDPAAISNFRARIALVSQCYQSAKFPEIAELEIRDAVEHLCEGRRSLEELAHASLVVALLSTLTERQRLLLEREAPERIKLKSGRTVRVCYESGKPPWIESRLQDFFGMQATPAICGGKVPLTIHLLAPNGRAVQVTRDLVGFWERHYPSIRKELQRRYPKHAWPEKPS